MKKIKRMLPILCLCLFCLFFSILQKSFVQAAQDKDTVQEERTILRVGYPIQAGISMKDEAGNYYGYMYDYLKELSQYTGWQYEFVEVDDSDLNVQLSKLLDMLHKGEIDMLGTMRYSEALDKLYDYPMESYGNAYTVLAVKNDNDRLDSETLKATKNLKVALLESATMRNMKLEQYAESNGLTYTKQYYENEDQQVAAVTAGKADALLTVDLSLASDFRTIARFSPDPFYFAVAQGKSDIVLGLNKGMEQLYETNPTLQQTLYTKYFDHKSEYVILTQQEQAYANSSKPLQVLVMDEQIPIQYMRNGEAMGTAVDILNYVHEETGLQFEFDHVSTYEEYLKRLKDGKVDILAAVNYDYSINHTGTMNVSNYYLKAPLQIVLNENTDINHLKDKVMMIRKELSSVLEERIQPDKVLYCDTTVDCLEAVADGEADYTIDGSYAISYYMSQLNDRALISIADSQDNTLNYSFGVAYNDDHMLMGILNKCIRNLSDEEINAYIVQHFATRGSFTMAQYVEQHAVETVLSAIFIVLVILVISIYSYRRQKKMKRQIEIEYSRYRLLGKITEEIIFEYDYKKDILHLDDKKKVLFANPIILDYAKLNQQKEDETTLLTCIMEQQDSDQEVLLELMDQTKRWFHIIMKVVYDQDQPFYAIGRVLDIQKDKLEREKLEKTSSTDALTSLLNPVTIKKQINAVIANTNDTYALGILDLDYFKQVNDQYGHFIGDRVLTRCAHAMREAFGKESILGRLGGDEFIIFLPNIRNDAQVAKQCQKIQQLMGMAREGMPATTLSIGFIATTGAQEYNLLYQEADKVLYQMKDEGRNAYRISFLNDL